MIRIRTGVVLLTCMVIIVGCAKREPIRESRTLMGTVVTISVFDRDKAEGTIHYAINEAFDVIARLDTLLWGDNPSSEVSKINENAGDRSAAVTDDVFDVIMEALKLFDKTQEAFDIRVGPLVDLWGFNSDQPSIPEPTAIEEATQLILNGGIFVAGQSIMLGKAGMKLDLSGLAKGYAVEKAVKRMADLGIQSAIVEAGGDLKTLGVRDKKGTKWHIAIRHPRNQDEYWGILDILDGAVATSGDYENFFEQDGKRYHHILDPKTGYPADQCVSVTVWGQHAMRCDALATALFVLGPEKGMEVINNFFPNTQVLFIVQKDGVLTSVMTPEFESVFRPSADAIK
jgi:thiamine biosynthesis lipoprotein